MLANKNVKTEDRKTKIPWNYEDSIWKPIIFSINIFAVVFAIYDYRNWLALVLGVASFFSLLNGIMSEAISGVVEGKLRELLCKSAVHDKLKNTIESALEHSCDSLNDKLDEIINKLGRDDDSSVDLGYLEQKMAGYAAKLKIIADTGLSPKDPKST